jgi:hypothetical protein
MSHHTPLTMISQPEDSIHPDAIQQVQVVVEVWVTDEEYKEARDRQELAWQDGSLLSGAPPLSLHQVCLKLFVSSWHLTYPSERG